MSFKLKSDQSLRKNLKRIVRKQIEGALKQLKTPRGKKSDETVHEIRKALKKVRAVLRLVRPKIGRSVFEEMNASLRDTARPLTEVRDARILIDVTDSLASHFKDKVTGHTFNSVREELQRKARAARKRVLTQQHAFSTVRKNLRLAAEVIKRWTDVPNKWSSIGKGLGRTYRQATDAFVAACANPQVEKLHEWRKQVKYLRYQLQVLRPIWPDRMGELIDEADRIGELLGDDHDLTLLRQTLLVLQNRVADAGDVELLVALIEHRQTEFRRDAVQLGERFFVESPADFARTMKEYWKACRTEHSETRSQEGVELASFPA